MSSLHPSIVFQNLHFSWPDGAVVLDGITGTFSRVRTGLIGANGVGKSTLLRLIAGQLVPTAGTLSTSGTVDYLPQDLLLRTRDTVADLLQVRETVDAVRAIEAGRADPLLFEAIGDDWDIEARAHAELAAVGLSGISLEREVGTLSGGEAMLCALVGMRVRRASIAVLDEPTNNLDAVGREQVSDFVRSWRGALVVVSHDAALLELMEETAELRNGALSLYAGPLSAYREQVAVEQAAARRAVSTAAQDLKSAQRKRIQVEQKIAKSARQGRKDAENRKYIPAVINDRRNSAEKMQGTRRNTLDDRVTKAQTAADAAGSQVRNDAHIVIDLPDPGVPAGRHIATLVDAHGREFVLQGPERWAVIGRNGVGKTTLVQQLVPEAPRVTEPGRPQARAVTSRVGYLSQRLDDMDDTMRVIEAVVSGAQAVPEKQLRNRLARLQIRGDMVDRPVGSLSGGERFRVALARILLADPPAQLIVCDEPTNNLDASSVNQLVEALANYRGALVVVSHDRDFLRRIGCTVELVLGRDGVLVER